MELSRFRGYRGFEFPILGDRKFELPRLIWDRPLVYYKNIRRKKIKHKTICPRALFLICQETFQSNYVWLLYFDLIFEITLSIL